MTIESLVKLLKVGLPTLLVIYLLGMIPGVRSPIDRIEAAVIAHDLATRDTNHGILRALRTICYRQVPQEVRYQCD